jgi:Ser/Thr protein kinase RdoA (MazF antagonist)
MDAPEIERAVAAIRSIVSGLGLAVDDVVVLHNSNKLALRLLPCSVMARVADTAQSVTPRELEAARFEVELAQRLAEMASPVAALDPRVPARVYERDGFVATLWTYYEPISPAAPTAEYAGALARLHSGLRSLDLAAQHFTNRVAEAEALVASPDLSPRLVDDDRRLLRDALHAGRRAIADRDAAEQLLHGEPHPGNLLDTTSGERFIDLETCCRGPVEFDLAHVPRAVVEHYPGVDHALLEDCRALVLAMVAAWRWDAGDQLPNGRRLGHDLVRALRAGPPWPVLDELP